MKNLIQFATVLFLLVQTIGYSQEKNTENIVKKQEVSSTIKIDAKKLKKFVNFQLQVMQMCIQIAL